MKRQIFFRMLITELFFILRFAESQTADKTNCSLIPKRANDISRIKNLVHGNRLIKFQLKIDGHLGRLGEKFPGGLLDPKEWILLTDDTAQDLLLFPDNHVQKSLYALSFHTVDVELSIFQKPEHCFNDSFTLEEIMNTIRMFIKNVTSENSVEGFQICNRFIVFSDNNKTADLQYICCEESTNECRPLKPNIWLERFNDYLRYLQVAVLFLCSLLIPKSYYRQFNPIFRCQTDGLRFPKLKVNIIMGDNGEREDTNKYTILNGSKLYFERLKNTLEPLQTGTHYFQIDKMYINVDQDKLVLEGTHHLGLTDYLYENFVNCHTQEPPNDLERCLDQNMCSCSKCTCKRLFCAKSVMVFFTFCVITLPWWLMVVFYNTVNCSQDNYLQEVKKYFNIETFNVVSAPNISPSDYILYVLTFVFFLSYNISEKLQNLLKLMLKYAFQGVERFSDVKLVPAVLYPVTECRGLGCFLRCLGCFLYPIWIVLLVLYIAFRTVPLFIAFFNLYSLICKREMGQFCLLFIFCPLLGLVLFYIVGECLLFYTECIVYTLVGFLLYYDDVLPYVSFVLLIGIYGYNCFHRVYVLFSEFNKLLSKEAQKRMSGRLQNIKCPKRNDSPQKEYINDAHMLPRTNEPRTNENLSVIDTRAEIILKDDKIKWKAPRLVSFMYTSKMKAEMYLSRKFFEEINKLAYTISPGDQGFLYLKSCRDFGFVALFLFFVIIVVFALGKAHDLPSGAQTLVALGGGFLPFILQKVFFRTDSKDVKGLNNEFWKKMIDFEVENFFEWWDVIDADLIYIPLIPNHDESDEYQDHQILELTAIQKSERDILLCISKDQQLKNAESRSNTRFAANPRDDFDYKAL